MQQKKSQNGVIALMIVLAALSRLIPHAPNFTSIEATAIFAGAMWGLSLSAFLVPVLSMLLTDLIFGFHSSMFFVYGSLALSVMLGAIALQKRTGLRILGCALLSSLIFFLVTNFGVWLGGMYPQNTQGLIDCYVMALPFFRNQVTGDLVYSALIFASYELVHRKLFAAPTDQV